MKKKLKLAAESYCNANSFWGALTIETLTRLGVERVVISPGSRSTVLTVACALNKKIKTDVILDERSAAFFALGLARASASPVALICTSGSALSHYFPAVIEAYYQQVPLVVLSTDRPAELRDCQSGQSIDQGKIFGHYARFFHEVALPEAKQELWRYLRQTLVYAVGISRKHGPVHLNFPFRDPLVPTVDCTAVAEDALDESFFDGIGFSEKERISTKHEVKWDVSKKKRCLIVVGQYRTEMPELFAESLRIISEKLNAPILSDVLNPLRSYADIFGNRLICGYDRVLRDKNNADSLEPDFVLQIGVPPISKVLRSWLEKSCKEALILEASDLNANALHLPGKQMQVRVECMHLDVTGMCDTDYLNRWIEANERSEKSCEIPWECANEGFYCEGVASKLVCSLPEETPIFIANSLSIRNAEWFFPANEKRFKIYCNRGANGIDGTVSTALGVAVASNKPTVLWVGDLAFLHDTNALLMSGVFSGSLTIVLIQNHGGRIFEHLPICDFPCAFEHYFIAEQKVDIPTLVSAYGISHATAKTCSELEVYLRDLPEKGIKVIECMA